MIRLVTLLFLLLTCQLGFGQDKLSQLFQQLKQSDYSMVFYAKNSLVDCQKRAIPGLISMLSDNEFNKLTNTADLIYPGAQEFYGHGGIVDYNLDWIAVRAAWTLEEITFQDFGYYANSVSEAQLIKLHQKEYAKYAGSGVHSIMIKSSSIWEQSKADRIRMAFAVAQWWDANKSSWNRFDAIIAALSSNSERRKTLAIHYLRFENTACNGLTIESYNQLIRPLIAAISTSKDENAEQARLLLADKEYYWFKEKR